jgi:murein DD-endopeptidase MepM/ murein hydrolase activator NlpD
VPNLEVKGCISSTNAEYGLLVRSLDVTERQLADAEKEIQRCILLDEKVRVVSDLEIIHEEVRSLGVGGTGWHLKEPEHVRPDVGKRLARMGEQIEYLKRQARFEQESFEDIVSSLKGKKDMLVHTPSIMVSPGFLTSYYGWRRNPMTSQREFHRGLDIANLPGTPVVAAADGKVTFAGWKVGFGRLLEIDHGYGYVTRYGHLKAILAMVGDRVFRGETIGLLGSSGNATGPHVHYEVLVNGRHANPREYIGSAGLF